MFFMFLRLKYSLVPLIIEQERKKIINLLDKFKETFVENIRFKMKVNDRRLLLIHMYIRIIFYELYK